MSTYVAEKAMLITTVIAFALVAGLGLMTAYKGNVLQLFFSDSLAEIRFGPQSTLEYETWWDMKNSGQAVGGRSSDTIIYGGDVLGGGGRIELADGSWYDGDFKDNKPSGYGRAFWTDSGEYEGEWLSGKPNGSGRGVTKKGIRYEGQVKDGYAHGVGAAILKDGTKYVGEFEMGRFLGNKGKK